MPAGYDEGDGMRSFGVPGRDTHADGWGSLEPVRAAAGWLAVRFRSSDEGRSAALDALRAIAALLVVFMHTVLIAPEPVAHNAGLHFVRSHLWIGVDIFFALSGFLIAGPFLRSLLRGSALPNTRGYAVRRVARIVPAYWVALTAAVLFVAPRPIGWGSVISHYLFLHNFVPGQSRSDVYVVAWTLGIEALFYIVVPIGAAVLRARFPGPIRADRLIRILLGVWAFSLVWGFVWGLAFDYIPLLNDHQDTWRTVLSDNLPTQLGLFCPGMILAVVFAKERRADLGSPAEAPPLRGLLGARSSLLFLLSLGLAIVGIGVGGHARTGQAIRDGLFLPLACGLLLLLFLRGGPYIRAISRYLAPVGVISYGIYLWHWIVAQWLADRGLQISLGGQWLGWIVAFVLLCLITFPLAAASWLFVEHPAMKWAADCNRRRTQARSAAAGRPVTASAASAGSPAGPPAAPAAAPRLPTAGPSAAGPPNPRPPNPRPPSPDPRPAPCAPAPLRRRPAGPPRRTRPAGSPTRQCPRPAADAAGPRESRRRRTAQCADKCHRRLVTERLGPRRPRRPAWLP
jgi:peptidoglycan/LPS O-acetylase OafA/YrhL